MLTLLRHNLVSPRWLTAVCLAGMLAHAPMLVLAQDNAPKVNFLYSMDLQGGPAYVPPLAAQDGNLYFNLTGNLRYLNTFPSPAVQVTGSYPAKPNCNQSAGWKPLQGVEDQDLCRGSTNSRLYQSAVTGHIYGVATLEGVPTASFANPPSWLPEGVEWPVYKGNLVRWRFDGGGARVLDASFNRMSAFLHGRTALVLGRTADGHDIVYGTDLGPDGRSRVWAVEYADDDARARFVDIHRFDADAQGFPIAVNDIIQASDGYLYVLLAYWRGGLAAQLPGMRAAPDSPTGAIVRLRASDPQGSIETVHTFTLAEGAPSYALAVADPFRDVMDIVNGEAVYYSSLFPQNVQARWQELRDTYENGTVTTYLLNGGSNIQPRATLLEGPDGYIYGNLGYDVCAYYDDAASGGLPMYQACGFYGSGDQSGAYVPRQNPSVGPVDDQGRPVPPYDGYWLDAQGQRQTFYGSLYRVATAKPVGQETFPFQILHRFRQTDGVNPKGDLALGGDGAIYGTTLAGGAWREHFYFQDGDDIVDDVNRMIGRGRWGEGTLFRIVPARISVDVSGNVVDSGFEHLHSFHGNGETLDRIDGAHPWGVAAGPDGNLYGMTRGGGRWAVERWDELPDPRLGGSKSWGRGTVFQVDLSGAETEASITLGLEPPSIVTGMDAYIVWQGNKVTNCEGLAGYEGSGWFGPKLAEGRLLLQNVPAVPDGAVYNFYMACDATDATDAAGNPKKVYSAYAQLRVNMPDQEVIAERQGYGNGGNTAPWPLALLGAVLWLRRRARGQQAGLHSVGSL